MPAAKIAISIDQNILRSVDQLIEKKIFSNRSRAINQVLEEKFARLNHIRLAKECAKLNPEVEKAMADEGLQSELKNWPKY